MCESNAYIDDAGKETLFFEAIDIIRMEGNKTCLTNVFGEERLFEGRIKEISLLEHRIILKRWADCGDEGVPVDTQI